MNIIDKIDTILKTSKGVTSIEMNPWQITELREYLNLDIDDDLTVYRGLRIKVNEEIDDIRILQESRR